MSAIHNSPPVIEKYEYNDSWWIDGDSNPLKKGAIAIYRIVIDFFKFVANFLIGASNLIHGYEDNKIALSHEIPKKDWFEESIKNPPVSTTDRYEGPTVSGGLTFIGVNDPLLFGAEEEDVFEPKVLFMAPIMAPIPKPVRTSSLILDEIETPLITPPEQNEKKSENQNRDAVFNVTYLLAKDFFALQAPQRPNFPPHLAQEISIH